MLTQSEREWLNSHRTYCNYCDLERGSDDCEWDIAMGQCPIRNSHKKLLDALEFAERVSVKLSEIMSRALADPWVIENAKHINADVPLKWARLSVEEEMDEQVQN